MEAKDLMQGVSFSHFLLKRHLSKGDIVIDATAGNGKDTVFLAELVGESGQVIAFDIQQDAINHSRNILKIKGLSKRVRLIKDNHKNMLKYIDSKQIGGIIFNLGFLPGGDKNIITRADTTLSALKDSLKVLKDGGIIVIVIYTGHPGGEEEKDTVIEYCSQLEHKKYNVLHYNFINQKKPPAQLIAIKKRSQEVN